MSERRYTAKEMRESASICETVEVSDQFYSIEMDRAAAMLRQAADAEDENAKLRETINADSASMSGKDAVIAQLKARLEAVVKEIEDMRKYSAFALVDPEDFDDILRAARGEGGAE